MAKQAYKYLVIVSGSNLSTYKTEIIAAYPMEAIWKFLHSIEGKLPIDTTSLSVSVKKQ